MVQHWLRANSTEGQRGKTRSQQTNIFAAHMQQTTYGDYAGAFLPGAEAGWTNHSDAFRKLWNSQPRRRLPFRFGYVDAAKQAHLLITAPAVKAAIAPR